MKIAVFVPVYEDVVGSAEIFVGPNADKEAAEAFLSHTAVPYEVFAAAEDRDEVLRKSDTIGSYVLTQEVTATVEIKVERGIAKVENNPYDVDVTIKDVDNG